METKQFICMKWGTLYGSDYVNRLYYMIRANTTGPIRVVCLTDDTFGITPEVDCLPCPHMMVRGESFGAGWRKLTLWASSENLFGLTGTWMFFDLDVVVTGSLDDFFTHKPEAPFIVMHNWTTPGQGIGNTSAFRFQVGAATYLHDDIMDADIRELIKQYDNEQIYISHKIHSKEFWPDAWCVLFKVQCVPAWPLRFWMEPPIPEGARVVAFPGSPNPHEAAEGIWPVKHPIKKTYKYITPATWINRIYTESEAKVRA